MRREGLAPPKAIGRVIYSHVRLLLRHRRNMCIMPHFLACYNFCMIRRYSILFLTTLLTVALFAPILASAAGMDYIVPANCRGSNAAKDCSVCDLTQLFQNILNFAVFLAVFYATAMFMWAGGRYLLAIADPEGVKKAKDTFLHILIGFVLILSAYLIVSIIMRVMVTGEISGSALPWNQVCTR